MPTTVRSHAKINLGLGIGAPRPDGFHALVTVYQTLEMHDLVTVSARSAPQTAIRITSNDRRVPTDNRNTAWKMAERALQLLAQHCRRRYPHREAPSRQGGLGAGSANAVAASSALESRSSASNSADRLFDFAASKSPPRLARTSRCSSSAARPRPRPRPGGLSPSRHRARLVRCRHPSIGVSTPQAFRDWDELCVREGLTAGGKCR